MGRMLDALKRTDDANPVIVPATKLADTPPVDTPEEEMPFIEVGSTAKLSDSKLHLEMTSPKAPSLQVWAPQSVALKSVSRPATNQTQVAADLIAFHQPDHQVSQQYAALFAQLNTEPTDSGAAALVFTALAPGAGTTTAVLNLAIAGCKKQSKRIIVVDANLARPAVAARLGLTPKMGLGDVLEGKVALEQAVLSTQIKGLHVLPAGQGGADHKASSDAFRWVFAWLRQRYDVVLVDAPAWAAGDDVRGLLPAASSVYLVVDANEADNSPVRALTREVARLGSRLGGLIVTR